MPRRRDRFGRFVRTEEENSDSESLFDNLFATPSTSSAHTMNDYERRPRRTLEEYRHPTRTVTPSCIMFPPNAPHIDFRPGMIQYLPTFHGLESENPYVYIREFEEVVATFHDRFGTTDTIRLKFFPFSLKDKAKSWLYSLRPMSIRSWGKMTQAFFDKYFPHHKKNALKKNLHIFPERQ